MKRIRVPAEMLKAAKEAAKANLDADRWRNDVEPMRFGLEAALLWLSNNPQVPTSAQYTKLRKDLEDESGMVPLFPEMFAEWQRRMFQEEEPEIPEEIKDLLIAPKVTDDTLSATTCKEHNQMIQEAYRRGLRKRGE